MSGDPFRWGKPKPGSHTAKMTSPQKEEGTYLDPPNTPKRNWLKY